MQLIRSGHGRDLRVDFFRGVALWWIFTDHVPRDVLGNYSLHDVALCDAAEIFVLLAGFAAAKAYAGAMDRHGWRYGAADAIRRAWTLYVAHVFLFVLYATQVAAVAAALGRPRYVTEDRLEVLAQAPYRALLQALALRYQPSMLNILPLYVALLAMFAVAMPLLRRPRVLLALSAGLYLLTRSWALNLPGWRGTGWYFDPFAWQVVFVIGAVLAYAPPAWPRAPRAVDALAGLVVGGGLVLIFVVQPHASLFPWLPASLLQALLGTDKSGEAPARLISVLALLWLTARLVPAEAGWLRTGPAALLELLGQHSLPVFCFGIVLAFLCRLGLHADHGAAMQVAVNAGGALSLLAVAATAAWFGQPGRTQRPVRTAARAPFIPPVREAAIPGQPAAVLVPGGHSLGRFRPWPLGLLRHFHT